MSDFDDSQREPYDYDAARRAASESWREEQIKARLDRFYDRRPPIFAAPGELAPELAAWVERFLTGDRTGLVLVGPVGVGKSWSLWKIKETLIAAGWLRGIEIRTAHQLKQTTAPPVDERELGALAEASLVGLDDVGSIRVSDWDADNLMALVDTRWQQQLPTIVTSNSPKLRDLLGQRVASRLADRATFLKMTGVDRRRSQ